MRRRNALRQKRRRNEGNMKYINRKNTCCSKWDGLRQQFGEDDLLSMWVADMDFACPDCVVQASEEYVRQPLGYFEPPASYFETVARWEKEQHGYAVEPEWICVTPGVVPAIHWAVRVFTRPGDSVMISTPVYYPFMNAVNHCGERKLVKSELKRTDNYYEIDFERFEQDIREHNVKLYILCNPHNPVGRVWTEEELRSLLDICKRHGVMVISDEIHQDIINPGLGRKKVTAAAVGDYDDILITMAAASKTFNMAAVQNSFIIIPKEEYRKRFQTFLTDMSLDHVNGLGYLATEAALKGGRAWLEDVLAVIYGNYDYVKRRFAEECPQVKTANLEGTYLLWIDFSALISTQEEITDFLQKKCRIAMDYGAWFGGQGYDAFARMNLATSRENVEEACNRLIRALK